MNINAIGIKNFDLRKLVSRDVEVVAVFGLIFAVAVADFVVVVAVADFVIVFIVGVGGVVVVCGVIVFVVDFLEFFTEGRMKVWLTDLTYCTEKEEKVTIKQN